MSREEAQWPLALLASSRLDRGVLDELSGGDVNFLCEVVVDFCSKLAQCLELAPVDHDKIRTVAHTLKASAHYVGAVRCSAMAADIELSILSGTKGPIERRWRSLQEEAKGLSTELRSFLRERLSGRDSSSPP